MNAETDVFNLIATGEWEEVLITLTKDMDPWDLDLIKISGRFSVYIDKMRKMDLRVPARILLAAAIIYRIKVDTLQEEEVSAEDNLAEDFEAYDELYDAPLDRNRIVLPPITIPVKRMPKRKVTIDELVNALGNAMTIKKRREARMFFQVELCGEDISENIEELYKKINRFLVEKKMINFSELLPTKCDRQEKLRAFNSLLHLSNEEKIYCSQEKLFGDIHIALMQS